MKAIIGSQDESMKMAQEANAVKKHNEIYQDPKLISNFKFVPSGNQVFVSVLKSIPTGIITDLNQVSSGGYVEDIQTVIATGPDCRELVPGDKIGFDFTRFNKPKRHTTPEGNVRDTMDVVLPVYKIGTEKDSIEVMIITERDYLYKFK